MNTVKVASSLVSIPGSTWSWVYLKEAAELLGNPEAIVWASFRDSCKNSSADQFAYRKEGVWIILKVRASEKQDSLVTLNVESVLLPAGWLTKALKEVKTNRAAPAVNAKLEHLDLLNGHKITTMGGWRLRGCPLGGCPIHTSNCNGISERALSALGVNPIIADVEDEFFNRLQFEDASTWESRFVEAFEPRANQHRIWSRLALFMLTDEQYGVRRYLKTEEQIELVDVLIKLVVADGLPADWSSCHMSLFNAYQAYYTEDEVYDEVVRLDPDYEALYSACNIAGVFLYGQRFSHCAGEAIRSLAQARDMKLVGGYIPANEAAIKAMADKFIEIILDAGAVQDLI